MVILLVDALGWELASRSPGFATSLESRRRLDTVLGFSSGALPTLFTGRTPREHGRFLMYRRRSGNSPFRGFGALRWLPPAVRRSGTLTRALTREVARRGVRGYFNLYEVPRPLLSEFDLPERDDLFSPGGLPLPSLWDTFEASGLAWGRREWRTPEAENLAWLEHELERGASDLLFLYTADFDARLHVEGTRGASVGAALGRYDGAIRRAHEIARRRGEELWFYLLSDHGMVDISQNVDVIGRLAEIEPQWPRDYLAFFDSTMARFWWRSDADVRAAVRAALEPLPGHWMSEAELGRAGVPVESHAYGEDLFLLDPGALMVPSFMGRSPLRAMHGYDPTHPDMAALLWSNRPLPGDLTHLTHVRAFLELELAALRAAA